MSWRITDWNVHFENHKTRLLKRMEWVPFPNKMDGSGYAELLEHENGAAHFGVWCALVEIASKSSPRGHLGSSTPTPAGQDRKASDLKRLSRICRIPTELLGEAIERLLIIGWLENFEIDLSAPGSAGNLAPSALRAPDNAGSEPDLPKDLEISNMAHSAGNRRESGALSSEGDAVRARTFTERNGTEGKGREGKGTDDEGSHVGSRAAAPPEAAGDEKPSFVHPELQFPQTQTLETPSSETVTLPFGHDLNPKTPIDANARKFARRTRLASYLIAYMTPDHAKSPVKKPDNQILDQCLEAIGEKTDMDDLDRWLRRLRNGPGGQPPGYDNGPRSYSWFPAVLRAHFRPEAPEPEAFQSSETIGQLPEPAAYTAPE